jgi:hypothetical protein
VKTGSTVAKRPNSFVYRYVPAYPGDLHNGKLQVLQVENAGGPADHFRLGVDLPVGRTPTPDI